MNLKFLITTFLAMGLSTNANSHVTNDTTHDVTCVENSPYLQTEDSNFQVSFIENRHTIITGQNGIIYTLDLLTDPRVKLLPNSELVSTHICIGDGMVQEILLSEEAFGWIFSRHSEFGSIGHN